MSAKVKFPLAGQLVVMGALGKDAPFDIVWLARTEQSAIEARKQYADRYPKGSFQVYRLIPLDEKEENPNQLSLMAGEEQNGS